MIGIGFQFDTESFQRELAAAQMSEMERVGLLLEQVGFEVVAYLRSLTDEMRPPARAGEGSRQAHPGGWADVTGNLANAYAFEVRRGDEVVVLEFRNTMEYARELEDRDGYWVLSGVTEPGGPLEEAIRRALPVVAPHWRLEG